MTEEIKIFTSFTTSNCYIVRPFNDNVCFFIDLPPDLEPALEYVKKNNLSIGGAFVTHGHYDHSLGMEKFKYPIFINLEDEFLARNPQEQIKSLLSEEVNINPYSGDLIDIKQIPHNFINVYSNPGHTKGSVSFEFPQNGYVFTGDFVFKEGIGRTDLFSGSQLEMKNSLIDVFYNFKDDFTVMPGHGSFDKVINIKNNNQYIKMMLND